MREEDDDGDDEFDTGSLCPPDVLRDYLEQRLDRVKE